jgi:hypothetical protein
MAAPTIDEARIRQILKGRRSVSVVPMPGVPDAESAMVGVRVLSGEDVDAAKLDASQYVVAMAKGRGIDPVLLLQLDAEIIDEETRRGILLRAFVKVEQAATGWAPALDRQGEPVFYFDGPQAVRQLDTVLRSTLFQLYLDHQETVNPLRSMGDAASLKELADALKKEPSTADHQLALQILNQLDAPSLRSLLRSMASPPSD